MALSIFPDPVTGRYKDGWQSVGEELKTLLTPQEYDSVKRTTFNAFYTSPTVIAAIHDAIARLGIPANATVLEPGCGSGNFMSQAKQGMRFIGVELDSISGRIAKARHSGQDIRIENFRDTKLPEDRIDAVSNGPILGHVVHSRSNQGENGSSPPTEAGVCFFGGFGRSLLWNVRRPSRSAASEPFHVLACLCKTLLLRLGKIRICRKSWQDANRAFPKKRMYVPDSF